MPPPPASDASRPVVAPPSPQPPSGTREPFVIGVAGGTASGKSTVCARIMHQLQERRVALISQARAALRRSAARCGARERAPPR